MMLVSQMAFGAATVSGLAILKFGETVAVVMSTPARRFCTRGESHEVVSKLGIK